MKSSSSFSDISKNSKTENWIDIENLMTRYRPVPLLCSMRSVTPDSMARLREISDRGYSERKICFVKALDESCENTEKIPEKKKFRSSQTTKQINSKRETSKNQTFQKEKIKKNVSYKDLKSIHKDLNSQRKIYIAKKFNIICKVKNIDRICVEPLPIEPKKREDLFIVKTVYKKPALTFAEKLYRLQQVSVFK